MEAPTTRMLHAGAHRRARARSGSSVLGLAYLRFATGGDARSRVPPARTPGS